MRSALLAAVTLVGLGACGVDGAPIREGAAPPPVVTSVVEDAVTEPDLPRTTLFGGGSPCATPGCAGKRGL